MKREYTSLPPHQALYFEISLVLIDNLQFPDMFELKLDGNIIPGGTNLANYTPYFKSNICGSSEYPDNQEFTVIGSLPHNARSLTLEFVSKVVSQGAIGIRNINILLIKDSSIMSQNSCFRLSDNELMNIEGECESIKGQYLDPLTRNPMNCDSSCSECFGPSSHQCVSCKSDSHFNGKQCIKISPNYTSDQRIIHQNGLKSESNPSILATRMLIENDMGSMDNLIDAINTIGDIASWGTLVYSASPTGNPSAITIICLVKMIQSIRYIDVAYSDKLQYLLYKQEKSSISLNFNVQFSEETKAQFPSYSLPEIFEYYGLAGSFIVNYWRGLFTIMMAAVTIITLIFCVWLFSNTQILYFLSKKSLEIMMWNLFIVILCTNIDGIGVPSSLDFRNARFNSSRSTLGTLSCILINLMMPALIVSVPFMIVRLRRSRAKVWNIAGVSSRNGNIEIPEEESQFSKLKKRLRTCKILYKGLRKTTMFHQLGMFFFLIRAYFFHLIIGYLFTNPLVQAFFINIMGILTLLYLGLKRPFKSRLDLFKMIIYESIVALVNLCVLILALLDYNEYEASGARKQLGEMVIVVTLMFNTIVVVFMFSDVVLRAARTYRVGKTTTTTVKSFAFWKTLFWMFFYNKSPTDSKKKDVEKAKNEGSLQRKETIRKQFTAKPPVEVSSNSNYETENNTKMIPTSTPKSLMHLWPPRINFSDFSSPQNQNMSINSLMSITEGGPRKVTPLSLAASNRRFSSQLNLLAPTNNNNMDYIDESSMNLSKKDSNSNRNNTMKRRKDSAELSAPPSASASKSSSPTSSQNLQQGLILGGSDMRRRRSTRGRLFSYDNSPSHLGGGGGGELGRDLSQKRHSVFVNNKRNDAEEAPIHIKLDYSNLNPSSSGRNKNTLWNVFLSKRR